MADKYVDELSDLFAWAQDKDKIAILLETVLTPQEIEEAVLRWRLMLKLLEGETQRDIAKELNISLGKIARGSRLLKYGPPQFRDLVERYEKERGRKQ